MKDSVVLFGEISFAERSRQLLASAKAKILAEDPDYLLNVNESEYVHHLVAAYLLDPIRFYTDQITAETYEQKITAEQFPQPGYWVTPGQRYTKQVFKFYRSVYRFRGSVAM